MSLHCLQRRGEVLMLCLYTVYRGGERCQCCVSTLCTVEGRGVDVVFTLSTEEGRGVNVVSLHCVQWRGEVLMLSLHCLQRWGEVMLGRYLTWLMPFFVIVSTFSSANGCLFASGRCVLQCLRSDQEWSMRPSITLLCTCFTSMAQRNNKWTR